jgi:hypothetical protein
MDPGRDCVRAWEAMPDAVHGKLASAQAAWFDGHLSECDSCRRQLVLEQRLQRALSRPAGPVMDAEAGLQRLLSRIDRPVAAQSADALRPTRWVGRALVAALLLQAIGLGVMGAKLWSLEPAPGYRTYSLESAPLPAGAIRLVPDPAMEVADWNSLLRANGLRVVAGPNTVGGYTVAPLAGAGGSDFLVQRLRATRGIRLAEPIGGAQ